MTTPTSPNKEEKNSSAPPARKYLVTGGAGFIGSHLCEKLLDTGHRVVVLDDFNGYYDQTLKWKNIATIHERLDELVEGDIRDEETVKQTFSNHNFDGVFHLAARAGVRPSIRNPHLYFKTNVDGTLNLLESCREHGVRDFIFASSSSIYGVQKKVPFSETDPVERTISPYAASKIAGEQLCSNYAHLFGIHCMCMRFFTVYGPRQRPDLAIAKFTAAIREGQPIELFGDGTSARDYTYIDDILQGVLAASRYTEHSSFEIFNLGESATTTLAQLVALIESNVGKRAIIVRQPNQPGDVPLTCADISKARALLHYNPQTPIREGIANYVKWASPPLPK